MATIDLSNCEIYFNDVDMTGYTNEARLNFTRRQLDTSVFADNGWESCIAGVPTAEWQIGGPWGFEDPDDETWTHLSTSQTTPGLTIASTDTAADTCWLLEPRGFTRTSGGSYGDVATWNLEGRAISKGATAASKVGVYRGGLSLVKQTITGDTNGTAIELTGFSGDTDDQLGILIHVFADNGTSMDVIIERDDNSGFTTATTVQTTSVTAVGNTWGRHVALLLGNDTFYRARTANLVGTSFDIAVSIGHVAL